MLDAHKSNNLEASNSRLVVKHNDFLQSRQEEAAKINMSWMTYVLCNALFTLTGRLKDMGETLMHVLNAHVCAPIISCWTITSVRYFLAEPSKVFQWSRN